MNNILFLEFKEKLNYLKEREYIYALVSYHIAPTIMGIKPASIITLRNGERSDFNLWIKYGESFLEYYNIKCIEIKKIEEEGTLLFYTESILENILDDELVVKFIKRFGYNKDMDLNAKLMHLKSRFLNNCPHEMGIFLGFPLEDVENFIEDPNKECLAIGYWKVYNNLQRAKETFESYERTKDYIMRKIIE